MTSSQRRLMIAFLLGVFAATAAHAEDGYELWLRYRLEPDATLRGNYRSLATRIHVPEGSAVLNAVKDELGRALPVITGDPIAWSDAASATLVAAPNLAPADELASLGREGFILSERQVAGRSVFVITGGSDVAVLRGVFEFLRRVQLGTPLTALAAREPERVGVRMANHHDNPVRVPGFRDESIERGYAGESFFKWDELPGRIDPRLHDWARLLAAMGLNGVSVNNVNTAKRGLEGWRLLTTPYLPKLAAMAGVLRPYGVRLFISVNFFSPVLIDCLPTADPADPAVQKWWRDKADQIYAAIPDFGGFIVKADSEGEPGPMKYGRTHADGANMIAAALAPHGGSVHWRAFVYDRARGDRVVQAYSLFAPLDGQFAPNALVQIKNGPLDFQIREPVSSLLGQMPRTRQIVELQVTQEYTGQDKHVCFLAPMWQEVFSFDPDGDGAKPTLGQSLAGAAGFMNTGDDRNWTGHLFAQANTYAFGRLAWNPSLSPEQLAREWSLLTFGHDPEVTRVVTLILLESRRAYENYTSPLGLNHMTRRVDHFVPDPIYRMDHHNPTKDGVGFDRTARSGTGYAGQFSEPWRSLYENVETCPEDLLLFFHHVLWERRMRNGSTLIQDLYDRYYAGAAKAHEFVRRWETLRGKIDEERFTHVLERLKLQATLADGWVGTLVPHWMEISDTDDAQGRTVPQPHTRRYVAP